MADLPRSRPRPVRNVWVVVLHYRGDDDTRRCLRSLAPLHERHRRSEAGAGAARVTVLVCDNASPTDPGGWVAREFPFARSVRSPTNRGWAGGNNLAAGYAFARGADAALLLNNDTEVHLDLVAVLAAALDRDPTLGLVGPLVHHLHAPDELQVDGVLFDVAAGEPGPFTRRPIPPAACGEDWCVTPTDLVHGCCVLVRREAWQAAGPIDERFFLIHEETDLALRAGRAGWHSGVVNRPLVWHRLSATFAANGKAVQQYYDIRNYVRLQRRHAGGGIAADGRPRRRRLGAWAELFRTVYHYTVEDREAGRIGHPPMTAAGLADGAAGRWGPYRRGVRPLAQLLHAVLSLATRHARRR